MIAQPKKKIKELKVIDPKASQNLGILLQSSLKGMTFDELRTAILACDDSSLGKLHSILHYEEAQQGFIF